MISSDAVGAGGGWSEREEVGVDVEGEEGCRVCGCGGCVRVCVCVCVCDKFSMGRAFDLKNPVQPDDVQELYRIEVAASQSAERDLQRAES